MGRPIRSPGPDHSASTGVSEISGQTKGEDEEVFSSPRPWFFEGFPEF